MMKKNCMFITLAFSLIFVFVGAANVFARVNLDASPGLATVPAERTQGIGTAYDGVIQLQAAAMNWRTGAAYTNSNLLRMTIPKSDGAVFKGTWVFIPGGSTVLVNNDGANTLSLQLPKNVAQGSTFNFYANATTAALDLSSVTKVGNVNLQGVNAGVGAGTVDPVGTDPIVVTVTQFGNSAGNNVGTSTIDVINQLGKRFLSTSTVAGVATGNQISQLGSVVINSTNVFPANNNCPNFTGNDRVIVTLSGANAFQGVSTVYFYGAGASTIARGVGNATNSRAFTFSLGNLNNGIFANTPGANNEDMAFLIKMSVSGTTDLKERTIAGAVDLALRTSGNGTIDLGSYGNVMNWAQNGTLFRANYYRNDSTADNNNWYKFSNSTTAPVTVEARFMSNDGTTTTNFTALSDQIPANGVLTVSKATIDTLFTEVSTGTVGWLEFRVHTGIANTTGIINAKSSNSFFNVPMHYLSGGLWR
jgi:hypothetical protein